MSDTFIITILFIILCAVVIAFIKGRVKDRCLRSFSGYKIVLYGKDGKTVSGRMCIESSGIELVYDEIDSPGLPGKSYILYKNEYEQSIFSLVLRLNGLADAEKNKRLKEFNNTIRLAYIFRLVRKVRNFFNTVRDSLMELGTMFVGRFKASSSFGNILKGQDKYINKMQQEGIGLVSMAYEPLLEKYIGKRVIFMVKNGDKINDYTGVLKDYTADFIQFYNVYDMMGEEGSEVDLIMPRNICLVRHAA